MSKTDGEDEEFKGRGIKRGNYQAICGFSGNKKPRSLSGVLKLGAWQCPTLAWRMPHYHRRYRVSL
ncbi:hypothetical protein, partial [Aeromonas veronii]|uniref:hypothetical protein n=1 Tax=Aeromonas veronii TaxID=654 RepID=UPI003F742ABD